MKQIPPFLLGEVEWPDAITSGDLLFHIPVQLLYGGDGSTLDISGNVTITAYSSDPVTQYKQFKLAYPSAGTLRDSMNAVNLLHDELFWDDATKTPKWIVHKNLGAVYKGINYIFQDNKGDMGDLLCFATQRTSSTSPSIEQVAGYLSLNVGDIFSFDGTHFRIGDTIITI